MDSYIIQVRPQDELTVIIDKLIHTQAERIYLLVPDSSRIAQHALNFRLIKREADALGKEIVVVSASPRVQNLALKSQLQAHKESHEFKEGAARPKLSDIEPPSISTEESALAPRKAKKLVPKKDAEITSFWTRKSPVFTLPKIAKKPLPDISRLLRMPALPWPNIKLNDALIFRSILISLIIISIGVAAVTFYFILPKAKIYIKPIVEKVVIDLEITGDINISSIARGDGGQGPRIPAQIFEKNFEVTKAAPATGEKEVRERAQGVIKVYNSYSSSPQTLVKTTRFVSERGEVFRTIDTVVVPGAQVEDGKIVPSSTFVKVLASEPGDKYNIGPSTFSIPGFKGTPKYLAFYGESKDSMSGGETGKVKVVTRDDYNNVEKLVREELALSAAKAYEMLLPEGFFIPEGATESHEPVMSFSAKVDDKAEEFTITGAVSTKTFAVRKSDVESLFEEEFMARFPNKRLLDNGEESAYEVIDKRFDKGTLKIKSSFNQSAASIIDEKVLREGIRGKGEEMVRGFLSEYPGILEVKVTFWPFWVQKIPADPNKIEIIIE